jgi:multiple sugar transport system substrate-binding protein
MFEALSLSTPKTWEDAQTAAKALVKRDSVTNKITRGGIALGNTVNVDYWPDIVSLMLLQGGANLLNPNATTINSTLRYYTSFASGANAVWDNTLPNSTIAFANEKVAMILAPSWKAVDIQTINPNLTWKVVPVPQLPDVTPVNWTSFWVEAVPKNSQHSQEAWKFLTFLSSAKAQQLLFESASKERGFSQSPAHKSVASIAQANPIAAPFVEALPTAQTFYTASLTHDSSAGMNSRLIKYLEDAVNAFASSGVGDTTDVVTTLTKGFNQVLSQYRLVSPLPTTTR